MNDNSFLQKLIKNLNKLVVYVNLFKYRFICDSVMVSKFLITVT